MNDFDKIIAANWTSTQLDTLTVLAIQGAYADVKDEFNSELGDWLHLVETWR